MKNYIILIMVILFTMTITGCSSVLNYQRSIFNEESKIIKSGDSHSYKDRIGSVREDEIDIKFSSFSGTDTIWKVLVEEDVDIVLDFKSVIDKGEFKVVLITPNDEIVNIINGTEERRQTILLKKGTNRIKLVGKEAKGEIKMNIDGDSNIKVKVKD